MNKAVIFDLDGTMWDSSLEVAAAYNLSLEKQGLDLRFTVGDIRAAMGKTMVEIAHMYFDSIDRENAEKIMEKCIEEENLYLTDHSGKVYDGLEDTLIRLKNSGWKIICVSNCQKGYIEAFYQSTGLGKYFSDKICWGDTGLLKAGNISLAVSRNIIGKAVYVGDTLGDYDSSREAGVLFIHSAYGYGTVPEGTPAIGSLRELPDALEKILN